MTPDEPVPSEDYIFGPYTHWTNNNGRKAYMSSDRRFAMWSISQVGDSGEVYNKWIIGLAKDIRKNLKSGYMAYKLSDAYCPYETEAFNPWQYEPENGSNRWFSSDSDVFWEGGCD